MKYPFVVQEDKIIFGVVGTIIFELKRIALHYNLLLEGYKINFTTFKNVIFQRPLIIQIYKPNVGFHFIIIYKRKTSKYMAENMYLFITETKTIYQIIKEQF